MSKDNVLKFPVKKVISVNGRKYVKRLVIQEGRRRYELIEVVIGRAGDVQ